MLQRQILQTILSSMARCKKFAEVLTPPPAVLCCASRLKEGVLVPRLLQLPAMHSFPCQQISCSVNMTTQWITTCTSVTDKACAKVVFTSLNVQCFTRLLQFPAKHSLAKCETVVQLASVQCTLEQNVSTLAAVPCKAQLSEVLD